MITFACGCGEPLAAAPEHAGLQVQCPRCNKLLTVPARPRVTPVAVHAPAPPPKKKPVLVEDESPKARKKAALVDDEDDRKPRKKKKKKRNYGDDDEPEHVRALMAKANAELDEEEERHRREGGGIHFTPGIIGGLVAFVIGSIGVVLLLLIFPNLWAIAGCGAFALGGLVRCVLAFMGQGVD